MSLGAVTNRKEDASDNQDSKLWDANGYKILFFMACLMEHFFSLLISNLQIKLVTK